MRLFVVFLSFILVIISVKADVIADKGCFSEEEELLLQAFPSRSAKEKDMLLGAAFHARKFPLVASLLKLGADPFAPINSPPVVDLIFEDLIISAPSETFLPVLKALFQGGDRGQLLSRKSERTGLLLVQFIQLSPERLVILRFIKDHIELLNNFDELTLLQLDAQPFLRLYQKSMTASNPVPSAMAWDMYHSARIIEGMPYRQVLEYVNLFNQVLDEYLKRKFSKYLK